MPQYFDRSPAAPSRPATVEVVLPGLPPTTFATDRGVFSGERLDHGTRVLLEFAPPAPATGDLLDLGCGWGPIACVLALRSPGATVWAVDVNERAVELTRRNAAELGLGNVRACLPDEVPDDLDFAALRSNPPIRIGLPALRELLGRWLPRLADGGEAVLVVQKHLGSDTLAARLVDDGWAVERLRSKQGFRLLGVRR